MRRGFDRLQKGGGREVNELMRVGREEREGNESGWFIRLKGEERRYILV